MIDKVQRLYPTFNIYVKKNNKIYNLNGSLVDNKMIKSVSCVVIEQYAYTVYKNKKVYQKINFFCRKNNF